MAQSPRPVLPHRHNRDGTFDSICSRCFATIATEGSGVELKKAEDVHICHRLPSIKGGNSRTKVMWDESCHFPV